MRFIFKNNNNIKKLLALLEILDTKTIRQPWALQGPIDLPTPFPTERNQDFSEKWPSPGVPGLAWMSLEYLLAARRREALKTTHVGSKGARRGSHRPKRRQLDLRWRVSCNGLEPTRSICIYKFMMTPAKTLWSAFGEVSKSTHYLAHYKRRERIKHPSCFIYIYTLPHSNRGEVSFYRDTPTN